MVAIVFTLFFGALLLLLGEYLHRKKYTSGESSRKFVHISFGLFAASWAHYMTVGQLVVLSLLLFVGVSVSYRFRIFRAIHQSKVRFVGEVLFATGILVAAVFSKNAWIYTVSILCLSLADGMAAVVGKKHKNKVRIYGNKTLGGTLAFFVCSVVSLVVGYTVGGAEVMSHYMLVVFVWLPMLITFTELVAPWGTDNILVPLAAAYVLNTLVVLQL